MVRRGIAVLMTAVAGAGMGIVVTEVPAGASHAHNLDTPGTTVVDIAQGQTSQSSGPACHQFHEHVHLGTADAGGFLGDGHSPVRVYKTETAGCTG